MRSIHLGFQIGVAISFLFLPGCNRAKRARCEDMLVKMAGPQAAKDRAYHDEFIDDCLKRPDDVLDCEDRDMARLNNGQAPDPACDAKISQYLKSQHIDPEKRLHEWFKAHGIGSVVRGAETQPVDAAAGR